VQSVQTDTINAFHDLIGAKRQERKSVNGQLASQLRLLTDIDWPSAEPLEIEMDRPDEKHHWLENDQMALSV